MVPQLPIRTKSLNKHLGTHTHTHAHTTTSTSTMAAAWQSYVVMWYVVWHFFPWIYISFNTFRGVAGLFYRSLFVCMYIYVSFHIYRSLFIYTRLFSHTLQASTSIFHCTRTGGSRLTCSTDASCIHKRIHIHTQKWALYFHKRDPHLPTSPQKKSTGRERIDLLHHLRPTCKYEYENIPPEQLSDINEIHESWECETPTLF